MRLYLSSFRIGDHPECLAALVGDDSRRTVVIANALDDAPDEVRRAGVERGASRARCLLAQDALVYGGYSAGPCVLSPSLRGLEAVDDAEAVVRIYRSEPVWEGLALLDKTFVPHYRPAGHPETTALGLVAEKYRAEEIAHLALQDGQALLINGANAEIV